MPRQIKAEHLNQTKRVGAGSFFCQNLEIAMDNSAEFLIRLVLIVSGRKIQTAYTPFSYSAVTSPGYSIISVIDCIPAKCRVCHNLAVNLMNA